jgi:gliding motility-associated-like protein
LLAVTLTGVVDVFDFDRCTGQLSNWLSLGTPALQVPGSDTYYGCSFSPDGTKIYASEENNNQNGTTRLFQWDLLAPNIPASKTLIGTTISPMEFGQHQLGPDGKIYIANLAYPLDSTNPNNYYLSVIHDPNQAGLACNFVYNGLWLEGRQSTLHLPNLPNYNLAPLVAQNAQAGPPQVVLCAGDSVMLGYPDTTGGAVSFAWNSHPDISDTTQPQQWVTPSQSTWYYLTVVDSAVGIPCGVTRDSVHVIVADSNYFPVANAGNDTTICPGDTVLIGANAAHANWQYQWSTGSDSTTALVAQPGTYTLIITNSLGFGACFIATDTVVVDTFAVFPNPVPTDTTICLGDSLVLGKPLPPTWAGNWTPSAGLVFPDSALTLAYPPVSATYVLYATDTSNPGGCTTLHDTVVVRVEEPFTHPRPENQEFCPGEILTVGVGNSSGYSYAWSPVTGMQNPYVSATTVQPITPITYTLQVTSDTMLSENCRTQYFPVALTTAGCVQQNVVTPNGDGINDFLDLGSFNGPVSVSVYDRWGALVFASDEYGNDWPSVGSALPETAYWYVVRVAGEGGKAFVGEVMVLR